MSTRDAELRRLNERRNNTHLSYIEREEADRTLQRISQQTKDSRLEELRWQMLRADEASDIESARRIGREIENYQQKHGL